MGATHQQRGLHEESVLDYAAVQFYTRERAQDGLLCSTDGRWPGFMRPSSGAERVRTKAGARQVLHPDILAVQHPCRIRARAVDELAE